MCQDQSRCLPKKFKCDGKIQCIDGSDEIEHCKYPIYFRYLQNNRIFILDWLTILVLQQPKHLDKIKDYDAKIIIKESKKVVKEVMFGIKCKSSYRSIMNIHCTVPQPNIPSTKFCCENQEDRCFNNFEELTCFRCFDGTIILNNQVCDGTIDCQDLSDECTCESSRLKPLCKVFYAKESLKKGIFSF